MDIEIELKFEFDRKVMVVSVVLEDVQLIVGDVVSMPLTTELICRV
jgi:hypothetical protein